MLRCLLLIFIFAVNVCSLAQTDGGSILANERSIDRPVTLHKGQVRLSGGYNLNIVTSRFDVNGEAIKLSDEGLSSVRHVLSFELKYGILEFLEFQASLSGRSQAIRLQNEFILSDPAYSISSVTEIKGADDIFLGLNVRYPFKTRAVDVELLTGVSLPTANSDPAQPEHAYFYDNNSVTATISYHDFIAVGKGVPVVQLGGLFKYRSSSFAYSAFVMHRHGLKDQESFDWAYQLDNNENFEYRKDPYTLRYADRLSYYVEVEYQPLPWFDIIGNIAGFSEARGWKQRGIGKAGLPESSLMTFSPGFEILITPKLWLRQRVQIPLSGENYESALGFFTTISYNFFPFE